MPPDVVDLTLAEAEHDQPLEVIPINEDDESDDQPLSSTGKRVKPKTDTLPTEYLPDDTDVIEKDAELQTLRALVADTRRVVQERHRLLTEATEQLRGFEEKLADRARSLRRAADAAFEWNSVAFPWDRTLATAVYDVFHIRSFRPLQREALNATLMGRDVFAVLPTGAGKSLIYQLAAVVDRGLTLVVTPLISLSLDQQYALQALNIRAESLDSTTSKENSKRIFSDIMPRQGKIENSSRPRKKRCVGESAARSSTRRTKWLRDDMETAILFVTPEQIVRSKRLMSRLEMMYEAGHLSRIAIDEAHCCSLWGHDFRADYRKLGILRRQCPETPILALSATSNPDTTDDVCKILEIPRCVVFRGSINRANLYYEVRDKPDEEEAVVKVLADMITTEFSGQCGIVYVLSRRDAERYAASLRNHGVGVACYHGDMEREERSFVHGGWIAGELQVVVATIAFGLGIDNQRVRFVVHATMATSIEGYYQESGRAGRDGRLAKCVMLHRAKDFARLSAFVADKGEERVKKLYDMYRYASGRNTEGLDGEVCRRAIIAAGFGEKPPKRGGGTERKGSDDVRGRKEAGVSKNGKGRIEETEHCCDLCKARVVKECQKELVDVTPLAKSAVRIVVYCTMRFPDEKLTLLALATDWSNNGKNGRRLRGSEKAIDRLVPLETRLEILISLVLAGALEEYHRHSSYAMNAYVTAGQNVGVVFQDEGVFQVRVSREEAKMLRKVVGKIANTEK